MGILPDKSNIFLKKIIDSNLCPIYSLTAKSVCHALWSYEASSYVWAEKHRSM